MINVFNIVRKEIYQVDVNELYTMSCDEFDDILSLFLEKIKDVYGISGTITFSNEINPRFNTLYSTTMIPEIQPEFMAVIFYNDIRRTHKLDNSVLTITLYNKLSLILEVMLELITSNTKYKDRSDVAKTIPELFMNVLDEHGYNESKDFLTTIVKPSNSFISIERS